MHTSTVALAHALLLRVNHKFVIGAIVKKCLYCPSPIVPLHKRVISSNQLQTSFCDGNKSPPSWSEFMDFDIGNLREGKILRGKNVSDNLREDDF